MLSRHCPQVALLNPGLGQNPPKTTVHNMWKELCQDGPASEPGEGNGMRAWRTLRVAGSYESTCLADGSSSARSRTTSSPGSVSATLSAFLATPHSALPQH